MKQRFRTIYKIRGLLMAPPFLFLVFVFYHETERDGLVWPIGLTIFALGVLLRVWSQVHVHYRLKRHKTLTTTGPYAILRNPIYVGNTVMLLGLTVVSELLWFLPIMLLWCMAVYSLVVRYEEAHLLTKYGEAYAVYQRGVSRWIPHIDKPIQLFGKNSNGKGLIGPSILAELHCLAWLIPLAGKELL